MNIIIDEKRFIETLTDGEVYFTTDYETTISSKGEHRQTLIYRVKDNEFIRKNYEKLKKLKVIKEERKIIVE